MHHVGAPYRKSATSGRYKYSGSTAISMFLICHMILRDLIFKGLYDFMGGHLSW